MQTAPTKQDRNSQSLFALTREYSPEPVIATIVRETGLSHEVARDQLEEVKRFMCLCAVNPDMRLATSRVLDEAWHAFILHTARYAGFCQEFLGSFVHHRPTDKPETESYERCLNLLARDFPDHRAEYWPPIRNRAADCDSGVCQGYCSCGTCEGG